MSYKGKGHLIAICPFYSLPLASANGQHDKKVKWALAQVTAMPYTD
ncbi:MAG: hypothetical protein JWP44_918 [Mucilaginibacter sp.]|nr:hypothetical protein [Mucilaginibacter sp.]